MATPPQHGPRSVELARRMKKAAGGKPIASWADEAAAMCDARDMKRLVLDDVDLVAIEGADR